MQSEERIMFTRVSIWTLIAPLILRLDDGRITAATGTGIYILEGIVIQRLKSSENEALKGLPGTLCSYGEGGLKVEITLNAIVI